MSIRYRKAGERMVVLRHALLLLALRALLVSGQAPPPHRAPLLTVTIGAIGGVTAFDRTLALGNAVGAGGRLALRVGPRAGLEVDATELFLSAPMGTGQPVATAVRGRASYWAAGAEADLVLGLGMMRIRRSGRSEGDYGLTGAVGLERRFADYLALRVEAIEDYIPRPLNGAPSNWLRGIDIGGSASLPLGYSTEGAPPRLREPVFFALLAAGTQFARLDRDPGGWDDTRWYAEKQGIHAGLGAIVTMAADEAGIPVWHAVAGVCMAGVAYEYTQGYASPRDMIASCGGALIAGVWSTIWR
ncbi:MAG: hypothetical protein NVS4B3_10410 [Gemmatimonadaceae bacterium]